MHYVELYRREAARLSTVAHGIGDPGVRAELLDIAARFLCLAEFRAKGRTAPPLDAIAPASAVDVEV